VSVSPARPNPAGPRLTADELARLDANMIACFQLLAMASNAGEMDQFDGIQLVATGAAAASLNVAFVTRPLEDAAASLARARAWFAARKLLCSVRVRSGLDAETGRLTRAAGFSEVDTMPAMLLPRIGEQPPMPSDLDILRADEEGTASDLQRVLADGFPMPAEFAALLVAPPLRSHHATELYVGYHAGEPVAASSLVITGDVAGVYNVATLPRFRRHGYGEAMTAHALGRGAELGCSMGTLQATLQGRSIYERMGFHTVAHYLTYQRPGRNI
jgi:ribosomal protein S18 acetylase RimI-like enzyme